MRNKVLRAIRTCTGTSVAAEPPIRSPGPGEPNHSNVGMTVAKLQLIDAGVKITGIGTGLSITTYSVQATDGGRTWMKNGPAADVVAGTCT
jgi:hypothetical protein